MRLSLQELQQLTVDGHLGASEGNNLILGRDGMSQRASPTPSRLTTPGVSRQNSSSALAGEASEVDATDMDDDDDDGETPAWCAICLFWAVSGVQMHMCRAFQTRALGLLFYMTLLPFDVLSAA